MGYLERRANRSTSRHANRSGRLPFAGVDGEGSTINGRHEYLLLRAGDELLINDDGSPLTWFQCLDFLCNLPTVSGRRTHTYVSYFFDYDVTMMLRSLPVERLVRLLDRDARRATDSQASHYPVDVGPFAIDYMPGKMFKVKKAIGKTYSKKYMRYVTVWTPWTEINDTGSFFQSSFVKALDKWFLHDTFTNPNVPTEQNEYTRIIEMIAAGKEKRHDFQEMDEYEIAYNRAECEMLVLLMENFRDMCDRLDIRPYRWQGPGNLVAAVMKREGVPQNKELTCFTDYPGLREMANDGYYGGRFECSAYGSIPGPVYQYDINSAYADTYRNLPCMVHSTWTPIRNIPSNGSIYVGRVHFKHQEGLSFGVLPVRDKRTGTLLFPMEGNGVYWSPELELMKQYGRVDFIEGWECTRNCECQTFDWVYKIYDERKRLKALGDGAERVLKLLLASTYGKLCQSVGSAPFANPVWAALIVSNVRASLTSCALQNGTGKDVLMLATDGIFCTEERVLPIGNNLGQWDRTVHDSMFIVQSGIYFIPGHTPKTRGIKTTSVAEKENEFRGVWDEFINSHRVFPPAVDVPIRQFIGLRLALARNKPTIAGQWFDSDDGDNKPKRVKFDWSTKRLFAGIVDRRVITDPIEGSARLESAPYHRQIGGIVFEAQMTATNREKLLAQEQPEWGPQFM